MSNYTKGKWEVVDGTLVGEQILFIHVPEIKQGGNIICRLTKQVDIHIGITDEDRANANLIACAPELVDALQALVDKHKQHYGLDGAWDGDLVKAEQLLDKVRGEK